MKTKLAYGILAAGLVAIPAYGEGEEGEGQETQTPEPFTATVVAGGTKTYTNADDWDLKEVPNGDHVDVVIDNNPEVNTTVNFNKEASNYTCGVLRIDAGDKVKYHAAAAMISTDMIALLQTVLDLLGDCGFA